MISINKCVISLKVALHVSNFFYIIIIESTMSYARCIKMVEGANDQYSNAEGLYSTGNIKFTCISLPDILY